MRHKMHKVVALSVDDLIERGFLGRNEKVSNLDVERIRKRLCAELGESYGAGFISDTLEVETGMESIIRSPGVDKMIVEYRYHLEDKPTKEDRVRHEYERSMLKERG